MDVPLSPHDLFCNGYGNPGNIGNGYVLGFVLGVGRTKKIVPQLGSSVLEEINAFDRAEVESTNIGQINMTEVSSFCGPSGFIWGYDIARPSNLYTREANFPRKISLGNTTASIYSLNPLLNATKNLFGTLKTPKFPLFPGSHVPCATKNITYEGKKYLYCSLSVGIPVKRNEQACVLMEDVGCLDHFDKNIKRKLIEKSAMSVLKIGENQSIKYKEIFTELKTIYVAEDEIGCALVASPYFTLAKKALSKFKLYK